MSTEAPFEQLIEHTLLAIEDALDAAGVEVDTRRSGPVLTLEFDDDSRIVINSQEAMRELWVACRAGGHVHGIDQRLGRQHLARLRREHRLLQLRRQPGPRLGEHGPEVWRDVLGLSDEEIGMLEREGVLR
mgnify:CR=1 FL=1